MTHSVFQGLWLPLVSPFRDGRLDEASLRRLVRHYAGRVDGFVLGGTTGEGMALSSDEMSRVAHWAAEDLEDTATPVVIGLGGASTAGVVAAVQAARALPAAGFLITCPYYMRPTQEGLRLHFEAIADSTDRGVLIYNIPYRTGVNLANDTLLRLAERANIVGVKDCCADPAQSADLIARKPHGFSVLTGEDANFHDALRAGADGGITASAHLDPEGFRDLIARVREGGETDAAWQALAPIPELLFAEPNPGPLKHALHRMGLLDAPDLRLPMTPPGADLAGRIDASVSRVFLDAGAAG